MAKISATRYLVGNNSLHMFLGKDCVFLFSNLLRILIKMRKFVKMDVWVLITLFHAKTKNKHKHNMYIHQINTGTIIDINADGAAGKTLQKRCL